MRSQSERYRVWVARQAAEWFVEHRGGPISASKRREFTRWLRASPLHVAEYLAVARTAQDVAAEATHVEAPLEQLLAEATGEEKVIPLPTLDSSDERSISVSSTSSVRAAAWRLTSRAPAVAVTSVVLAIGAWLWLQNPLTPTRLGTRYQTQAGEDRTVKLADDTIMYLTGHSTVQVLFDAHRRLVEIERGQVLFEVAHDASRPFEARARNAVIKDVGTIFDVTQDSRRTVVTVLEGQVALWTVADHSADFSARSLADLDIVPVHRLPIGLDAGEQARILPTGAVRTSRPTNLAQVGPWLEPQIAFDRESLAQVAAEFNRHNRVQIEVTDPHIATIPVSGVFHSYDVASFASFLNNVPGVRARMMNGDLQVSATAVPGPSTSPSQAPPR
jgi:transmembrane sensor